MKRSALNRGSKPLARGSWMKRSGRIKPMSGKRQRFQAELNAVRPEVYQRSGGMCEAKLAGCEVVPVHVHHKLRRSQGGGNDPANLLHVCARCHSAIHHWPKQALALGFLISGANKIAPSAAVLSPLGQSADVRAADGGVHRDSLHPRVLIDKGRVA